MAVSGRHVGRPQPKVALDYTTTAPADLSLGDRRTHLFHLWSLSLLRNFCSPPPFHLHTPLQFQNRQSAPRCTDVQVKPCPPPPSPPPLPDHTITSMPTWQGDIQPRKQQRQAALSSWAFHPPLPHVRLPLTTSEAMMKGVMAGVEARARERAGMASRGPPGTDGPVGCTSAPFPRPRSAWNSGRRSWKRWSGKKEQGSPMAVMPAQWRTPEGLSVKVSPEFCYVCRNGQVWRVFPFYFLFSSWTVGYTC